jgi:hypothetical protein
MSLCVPEIFGADPANITWQVVRGDSASIRVEFLEDDEVTKFDTSSWSFAATAYDIRGDFLDELEVDVHAGYVNIIVSSEVTAFWGSGFTKTVAELPFDLQVTLEDNSIWTPLIGTIKVLSDVTTGSL